jgi:hypothetical protein
MQRISCSRDSGLQPTCPEYPAGNFTARPGAPCRNLLSVSQALVHLTLSLTILIAAVPGHAAEYQLGQGLPVGDFLLSGYANVEAQSLQGRSAKLSLDDISMFVAGRVNRWINPFAEVELSSQTLLQQSGGPREPGHFVRERLYNDVHATDSDTLRIGKILAPVGEWNLIHAAPLVPTTTQPLTAKQGFSAYSTGLSWLHSDATDSWPDWQIYAQPGSEWLQHPAAVDPRQFREVYGVHLDWTHDLQETVGLSLQRGKLVSTDETYQLWGMNFRHVYGKATLQGEATTTRWSGGNATREHDAAHGLFLLADYAFVAEWHGIAEWEHFQDHQEAMPSRNLLLGGAYKPLPAVVWKLEYVHQMGRSHDIATGWLGSFAVLF